MLEFLDVILVIRMDASVIDYNDYMPRRSTFPRHCAKSSCNSYNDADVSDGGVTVQALH